MCARLEIEQLKNAFISDINIFTVVCSCFYGVSSPDSWLCCGCTWEIEHGNALSCLFLAETKCITKSFELASCPWLKSQDTLAASPSCAASLSMLSISNT